MRDAPRERLRLIQTGKHVSFITHSVYVAYTLRVSGLPRSFLAKQPALERFDKSHKPCGFPRPPNASQQGSYGPFWC